MQFPHNYAMPQQMFYPGGLPQSSQQSPVGPPPWLSVYSGLNPFFSAPLLNAERMLIANQASAAETLGIPKKKIPNLSKRALEARR